MHVVIRDTPLPKNHAWRVGDIITLYAYGRGGRVYVAASIVISDIGSDLSRADA